MSIDPVVTPYVDGELGALDRARVDEHVRSCPSCRARIERELAVRELVATRKSALRSEPAPGWLHEWCAAEARQINRPIHVPAVRAWRARLRPLALAATLVIIVGGAFLYPLTSRSTRVMAAELALDHMKCALLTSLAGTRHSPSRVEAALASKFNWPARLPEQPEQAGLELVGERTCLYGEGRIAHLMYRHEGRIVSVFMLPEKIRKEEMVSVFGHRAAVWSVGGRSFVLVGRERSDELQRVATFVRAGLR